MPSRPSSASSCLPYPTSTQRCWSARSSGWATCLRPLRVSVCGHHLQPVPSRAVEICSLKPGPHAVKVPRKHGSQSVGWCLKSLSAGPHSAACLLFVRGSHPGLLLSLACDSTPLGAGIGWNMNYPFSTGDLLCAGQTASTYLDNNTKVSPAWPQSPTGLTCSSTQQLLRPCPAPCTQPGPAVMAAHPLAQDASPSG